MNIEYNDQLTTVYEEPTFKILAIRVRNADGSELIRFHRLPTGGELIKCFEYPMSEVYNKVRKLSDYGVPLSPVVINAVLEKIDEQYQHMSLINKVTQLGFQHNNNGDITGYICSEGFDREGNNLLVDPYVGLPVAHGSFTTALCDRLNDYLSVNVKRQLVWLFPLSSVLCGILKKNLLLSVVGKSSKGKTVSTRLALSSFCNPDYGRLSKTLCGTDASILKYMDNLEGAPILLDDASLKDSEKRVVRFDNLVYTLDGGRSKGRLVKGNELATEYSWHTAITMSAEDSILDHCNPEREGAVARLIEINVSGKDMFDTAAECNELKRLGTQNHGVIVPIYTKHILGVGIDAVEKMYRAEVKRVGKAAGKVDTLTSRIVENISIITTTAILSAKALGIKFDTTALSQYLLSITADNITDLRVKQIGHTVRTEIYPELVEIALAGGKDCEIKGGIFLPNDRKVEGVAALDGVCEKYNLKPKQIKTELKNSNLLLVNSGDFGYAKTMRGKTYRGIALVNPPEKGGDSNE